MSLPLPDLVRHIGICMHVCYGRHNKGTTKAHVCRAVLESIAMETLDLFMSMEEESGTEIKELRVDGGASKSRFLMQYQSRYDWY